MSHPDKFKNAEESTLAVLFVLAITAILCGAMVFATIRDEQGLKTLSGQHQAKAVR